jgi:hypothetical protein
VVLDTQEKSKYKQRGDFGYIKDAKKQNLKLALGLLASCILIYIIGVILANDFSPFFTIASVVMILPTAQFLSKYLSYLKYKTAKQEEFDTINSLSSDFLVLGELPIIRGKKIYETLITTVTNIGIYVYIGPLLDVTASRRNLLDTKSALDSIISIKRLQLEVKVFDNFEAYEEILRTTIKSQAFNADQKQLAEIAVSLIEKAH